VWLGGAYRVVISSYANFHKALIENNKITSKRSDVGLPGWRKEIFAVRPGRFESVCLYSASVYSLL